MSGAECTIRPSRRQDAAAAAAIWADTARQHHGFDAEAWCWAEDAQAQWMASFIDLLDRPEMLMLTAERDGLLVAFAVAQIKPRSAVYAEGREGFIWDLGVRRDCRRQGLGRKLMDATFAELKARGVSDVILHVAAANKAATKLYESMGMRVIMHRMYGKL